MFAMIKHQMTCLSAGLRRLFREQSQSTGDKLDLQFLEQRILFNATPLSPDSLTNLGGGEGGPGTNADTADFDFLANHVSAARESNPDTLSQDQNLTADLDAGFHELDRLLNELHQREILPQTEPKNSFAEEHPYLSTVSPFEQTQHPNRELLIVDSLLTDLEKLLSTWTSNDSDDREFDVLLVGSQVMDIDDINQVLQASTYQYQSIHIVTHGFNGGLQIGSDVLSSGSLSGFQDDLLRFKQHLTADADLFLYGCSIASDESGRQFIDQLSGVMNVDVRASTDQTGSELLGGDWDLEYSVGNTHSSLVLTQTSDSWQHLLLTHTVRDNFNAASWSNNDGSAFWSGDWLEIDNGGTGVNTGDFLIQSNQLYLLPGDVSNVLARQANLSTADTATLTFDYSSTLDDNLNQSSITLEVSDDGVSWTLLDIFSESQNAQSGSLSFDLTPFISNQTTVRFAVGIADTNPFYLIVDNFQISFSGNTAPVLNAASNPSFPAVTEGDFSPNGVSIAALIEDGSITDPNGVAVEAVAVTAMQDSLGTWQYSLDNGFNWLTIDTKSLNSSSNELSLLLGPTAQVRMIPFGDSTGSLSQAITFRAWDQSSGVEGEYHVITSTGGASAFSTANDTISVVVVGVNDAPTFLHGDGVVLSDIGVGNDVVRGVAIQPDGKIVVAGNSENGLDNDMLLSRYNADGSLDLSFGSNGHVITAIGTGEDEGNSVAIQADGKILVGGTSVIGGTRRFAIARFDTYGSLDTSFGVNGIVTTSLGGMNDALSSISIQTDGKILAAGYATIAGNMDFGLVRYNSDGSLDTGFGSGGIVTTAVGTGNDQIQSVAIQSDGKILAGGYAFFGGNADFAVVRYNSNGGLDSSFGIDGRVSTAVGSSTDLLASLAIQTDGKILAAGYSYNGANSDFAVVRYNVNGSLDSSFGAGGQVTTGVGLSNDVGSSLAIQADGKILVSGSAWMGSSRDFATVRYNSNGTVDSSFGSGGKVTTSVGAGDDLAYSMAIQPDGQVILSGSSIQGGQQALAIIRYNLDGSLSSTFDLGQSLGGTVNYTEDGSPVILDSNVRITDIELWVSNFSGATLNLSRNGEANSEDRFFASGTLGQLIQGGNLTVGGTTIGTVASNSAGVLALSFNSNATNLLVNSALQQIAYSNVNDNPPALVEICWNFSDGNTGLQGSGIAEITTGVVTVNITATNDAPIAGGDVATATEAGGTNNQSNGTDPSGNVLINDSDRDTGDVLIVVGVREGIFVTASGNVGSPVNGLYGEITIDSSGNYLYTLNNNHLAVQALRTNLNTLSDIFTYTVTDNWGLSGTAQITVTIQGENDAPTDILGNLGVAENASNGTVVGTVTGQDPDQGDSLTYSLVDNAGGRFAIQGSTGQVTVANGVLLDYEVDTVHNITVRVTDIAGLSFDKVIMVNVTNAEAGVVLNSAASPTFGSVLEGTINPTGMTVGSLVVDGSITNPDGVAVEAIAVTGLNSSLGTWQYSRDNGINWLTIQAELINRTTDELALILGSTAQLRLVPWGDLHGTISNGITFRAWDMTSGNEGDYVIISASGSGTAFSANSDSASITVTPTNDAPNFLLGDGIAIAPIGISDIFHKCTVLQPDGKILMAGTCVNGSSKDLCILRFQNDGTLDTSFGGGTGKVIAGYSAMDDFALSITLQPDGKILIAGYSGTTQYDFSLMRLNSDGSLDSSFSGDGMLITSFGSDFDRGRSVMVQPDGKILVGGSASVGATDHVAVVRYNSDGSLDTGFGGDGKVTTPIGDYARGWSIALQSDAKILLGGYALNGGDRLFAVVRYNNDGTLDTSFNSDGIVWTTIGSDAGINGSLTIQADGKILIAGSATVAGNEDFAMVRYNTNGSLDSSFGAGGRVTTPMGPNSDQVHSITLQSDGKILLAGSSNNGSSNDFALARYNANGTLDTGFAAGGKFIMAGGPGDDRLYSVNVQTDGKIILGGSLQNGNNNDFALIRLNPNGTLDTTLDRTGTFGGTVSYTTGGTPVILNSNVLIFDTELTSSNNFNGATLDLARNGTANFRDIFSAVGPLSPIVSGGNLVVQGVSIGTVVNNNGGSLSLAFNSNATASLVNSALQNIAYSYSESLSPGSVQIQWTFSDGNNGNQGLGGAMVGSGVITVNIAQGNMKPIALSDQYQTNSVSILTVVTPTVLSNDFDPEGASLTAVLVTGPSRGSLTLQTDGRFVYVPDSSYLGTVQFVYVVSDGNLQSSPQTVSITVLPPPSIPNTIDILIPSTPGQNQPPQTPNNDQNPSSDSPGDSADGEDGAQMEETDESNSSQESGKISSKIGVSATQQFQEVNSAKNYRPESQNSGGEGVFIVNDSERFNFSYQKVQQKNQLEVQITSSVVVDYLDKLPDRMTLNDQIVFASEIQTDNILENGKIEAIRLLEKNHEQVFFQTVTPFALGTAISAGISIHLILTSQVGTILLAQSSLISPLDPLTFLDYSGEIMKSESLEDQLFEKASLDKARWNQ